MGQKKKKLGKGRLDPFYYLAKKQGYRSRAAFKLIQLNKKYNFLGSAKACLDLCAAPGGWMQVASKYMPVQSVIVGVDLVPIRSIKNCIGIAEDITTQKCRTEIKKALKTWKVDVCLHDGAPNMGTSWVQDAYQQNELVLHALKLATEFLTTGGWFVTKIFRGPDYNSLLWVLNKLFKKVESTKPQASRNASAEIFVVCQGYLNPKRIDPKLLDSKFVFKQVEEVAKPVDVLSDVKQKRNRQGYEDGVTMLFKKGFVSDFVHSTEHIRYLSSYNQLEFDEAANVYLDHPATTDEIKSCFKDLKVLGKYDFQKIIKWRKDMLAYKEELENPEGEKKEDQDKEKKPLTEEEMDKNLDEQMQEYLSNLEKKKKKLKKKENEKKRTLQKRIELNMHIPGDNIEQSNEADLFSARGKNQESVEQDLSDISDDSEDDSSEDDSDASEYENDQDREFDNDEYMEQQLEEQYKQYKLRIGKKQVNIDKVSKDTLSEQDREFDDMDDVEREEEDESRNQTPLLVGGKRKLSDEKTKEMFFDQDLFGGVEYRTEDDDDEEEEEEEDKPIHLVTSKKQKLSEKSSQPTKQKQQQKTKGGKYQNAPSMDEDEDDEEEEDVSMETTGFEEVPKEQDVEYSSESEEEEDSKVKTLAMGELLLRKKSRQELIDNAYHRYAFNDSNLPAWFYEDENRHNKPQTPITKEQILEIKRQIREIDSRPIKKVAEAKARKKMKQAKRLEKAKDKANVIVDNEEMSNKEKARALEKIYKGTNQTGSGKKKKLVVISKKFKTGSASSGKYKIVDKRMKKDLRAQTAKNSKKGKGGGSKKNKK
eukprot:gene6746-8364_t